VATSTTSSGPGGQMTLVEHLSELRSRLIKCLIAVAVGMLIVTLFYNQILDFLVNPYCEVSKTDSCALLQTDPLEGFSIRMKITGYAGIALAMPVLLWQLWRFISPGLYANERRYVIPFVGSALVLFALGAGIAYWTMPYALQFLGSIGGHNLVQQYRPAPYVQLITLMMLIFGASFEFPILLVFLQMAGIVEPDTLRRYRRHAFVGITVIVAVVTPSGDPWSMLALSVPMVIFYEVAVRLGSWLVRRRALQEAT
jgi:sec-independent protein translocase protein TatC